MIYNSIWADTYYTYSGQELEYYITMVSGNTESTIFNGKAYRRPGESVIKINVARIVEGYMRSTFGELEYDGGGYKVLYDHEAVKTFKLYSDAGVLLESFCFLNDWSYDPSVRFTGYVSGDSDGHYLSYREMYERGEKLGQFNPYYPSHYITVITYFNRSDSNHDDIFLSNRFEFNSIGPACGRGMTIMFQNRRGGWNCFYPMGKIEKADAMTSFNTEQAYNNNVTPDRGTIKHLNEVTRTWTVHTGWLTDFQAENIARNLLLSPNVFISLDQDLDNVIPVVITNGEAPHKSYDTEKGVVDYEITFEESQKKTRR